MQKSEKETVKKQKTYSLPLAIDEWLETLFQANREELTLIGISTKTKLLEVLARNGEQFVLEILRDLKAKRESRPIPQE